MRSSSKSRNRNKNGNRRGNSGGNVINRVFESAGPDGKVRGTPQQIIDKYISLAHDSQLSGDRVSAENFQQHAEHYSRILAEAQKELLERHGDMAPVALNNIKPTNNHPASSNQKASGEHGETVSQINGGMKPVNNLVQNDCSSKEESSGENPVPESGKSMSKKVAKNETNSNKSGVNEFE